MKPNLSQRHNLKSQRRLLQESHMPSPAVQTPNSPSGITLAKPEEVLERMQTTFDAIASRAFEIFERNGMQLGHDLEDWFQAEGEVLHPVHIAIAEADRVLTVQAEVPGFSEKDLQVSLEPRRLTITGKRESREEKKTKQTLYTERCSNAIYRVVDLPKEVDPSARGVRASYDQGVLTIAMPEVESATAREIKLEPQSQSTAV